jgi:alkanesulfonate monooxygenase SsuD/methylene tetrahydromethanopterin reductase-like flavin-dependent oxidoreductase (luciferase family)
MRLSLRYDMRAPSIGAPAERLYAAALDQCEWADRLGFETVYLAEHHGADDGYCASPMIQAAAILGRTSRQTVHFSALIAVLHHPLRLAEDLAALDLIGRGRIEMTLGIGYRLHEYAMFGIEKRQRVPILEEIIAVLEQAWTGEPFDFRGTTVQVRPTPVTRPPIYIGGSTEASARRAARLGHGYRPAGRGDLYGVYEAECERLGRTAPPRPVPRGPLFVFVSDDPERAWQTVAPHVLYTTNSNAEWAKERGVGGTPYPPARDVAEVKANESFAVVTPDECVELARELGPNSEFVFHPLMGGLDPDVAWSSLELFETKVLPRLEENGLRDAAQRSWRGPRLARQSSNRGVLDVESREAATGAGR